MIIQQLAHYLPANLLHQDELQHKHTVNAATPKSLLFLDVREFLAVRTYFFSSYSVKFRNVYQQQSLCILRLAAHDFIRERGGI